MEYWINKYKMYNVRNSSIVHSAVSIFALIMGDITWSICSITTCSPPSLLNGSPLFQGGWESCPLWYACNNLYFSAFTSWLLSTQCCMIPMYVLSLTWNNFYLFTYFNPTAFPVWRFARFGTIYATEFVNSPPSRNMHIQQFADIPT